MTAKDSQMEIHGWLADIELERVAAIARATSMGGEVNSFIPALGRVPRDKLGIAVHDSTGALLSFGDVDEPFSIQSISKLFALMILMERSGDELWRRVRANSSVVERFDSIASLEFSRGIPSSPFLNAGALVMTDMLLDMSNNPEGMVAELLARFIGVKLRVNEEVAQSEIETADRNRAIGYYLRSFGNVRHHVDEVVEVYCRMCAIELSANELAAFAVWLGGKHSKTTRYDSVRLLSVMRDCGLYGESLDISRRHDIPAKSGSGGGTLAVMAPSIGLGVWSPPLGTSGNSLAGISVLTQFARAATRS